MTTKRSKVQLIQCDVEVMKHVQCEAAHREIHYKYIFLILKIPEIAQIEKSFNYFSHKVLGLIKLIK